jgi:hypothetical protein
MAGRCAQQRAIISNEHFESVTSICQSLKPSFNIISIVNINPVLNVENHFLKTPRVVGEGLAKCLPGKEPEKTQKKEHFRCLSIRTTSILNCGEICSFYRVSSLR